ncbi:hypothetical protein MFLO_15895 [Listeria floridensis FSL S10-1187]|uniref:YopX protein domain-containing protein n=3 Tax=Listeria floridensis FSL S10-1187 TaxID=1265817 RepID=A0ABP3ATG3_9LIST|nr:YopX family protein [Listeria floridensis]EUJ23497.1 hypothetical protein MFLO_15895 [Listeria floridensis FSL S10-1187]
MRPIEFRVYEPYPNYMSYSVRLSCNPFGSQELLVEVVEGFGWIEVEEKYLMQYTGLKDKRGSKIFEGDIIKIKIIDDFSVDSEEFIGVVEFLEGSWVITNHKRRESINLWSELNELEVIGNKWQNPELLEGVK